jgi:hypothetical protein
MEAGGADAPSIEGVPLIAAGAEPFVFLAGRPAAQRAADARAGRFPVSLNVVVRRNGGSISLWTHTSCSPDSVFFVNSASIPDHVSLPSRTDERDARGGLAMTSWGPVVTASQPIETSLCGES